MWKFRRARFWRFCRWGRSKMSKIQKDYIDKLTKSICYIHVIEKDAVQKPYHENLTISEKIKLDKAYFYDTEKKLYYPRISLGSGVLIEFEDKKYIMTAAHVLYGNRPFRTDKEANNVIVMVQFPAANRICDYFGYSIGLGNFANHICNDGIVKDFPIDLAFLKISEEDNVSYFATANTLSDKQLYLGQDVIGLGFSSEFPARINMDCIIKDDDKLSLSRQEIDNPPLIVKKGYISATYEIKLKKYKYIVHQADMFMTRGASGGGIFNEEGECIGLITEKGAYIDHQEVTVHYKSQKYTVSASYPIPTSTVIFIDTKVIKECLKELIC